MEILKFSKALSDEIRVRLLAMLRDNELNVGEVVQVLGMSQPRVSRHLKILHESGLLESRREGLWNFYRLAQSGNGYKFAEAIGWLIEDDAEISADKRKVAEVLAERNMETRKFFDEIAEDWEHLQREVFGDFNLNSELLKVMDKCSVGVDLGCGNGSLIEDMLTKCTSVIGVDSSHKMLELASNRIASHPDVSLRIGELTHLPLRDWEADFAVISMVLHHLPSPEKAVSEAARTLSSGGKLVIADFLMHSNEKMRSQYGDRRLGFTEEELGGFVADAGLVSHSIRRFAVNEGLTILVCISEKK
ncbi:ArsR/SmtB family transcription factor [Maridesulfovibrio hydrothermalis]|uniref:Transcriptional regulator, ArsR family n=1 Tax=Maridesulfovibrio hydrothermalis AM13 = DSM 14728 TaxID=1121451 RepID=L0RC91_9BACT|nr:metalloregulator ArsR/SmtB family transcription factor [Maridesulfovibrio hydrothermalis]CCO23815.1 Transcriptional regulator, ArsR family [Maridesulfovibrio hydrothermalis AM13 = DSM 14728]